MNLNNHRSTFGGKLTKIDVGAALKRLDEEQRSKEEAELGKLEAEYCKNVNAFSEDDGDSQISTKPITTTQTQLWVDKYQAKCYMDLLTDEATNRNVLTWLKSWDKYVFPEGYIPQTKSSTQPTHGYRASFVEYSLTNRRYLVVHGPPGTGHSTMVSPLAKQCGYMPILTNPSDIRSGKGLLELV